MSNGTNGNRYVTWSKFAIVGMTFLVLTYGGMFGFTTLLVGYLRADMREIRDDLRDIQSRLPALDKK